jgi:hypothetical protein
LTEISKQLFDSKKNKSSKPVLKQMPFERLVPCYIKSHIPNQKKQMKNTILIASAFILASCASNPKPAEPKKNSELVQLGLKGKVQTLEEHWVNFDSLGNAKSDSGYNTTSFDANGYQTTYETRDSSGKVTWSQVMSHNEAGLLTELKNSKNGKQQWRLTLESDDKGYTKANEFDSTDKPSGYYTDLKTNEYGEVTAGTEHFMDGRVKSTFQNNYQGVLYAGGKSTDSTGKTSYESTVKSDENGNAIEEHSMNVEKDSTIKHDYTYIYEGKDDAGNWLKRTQLDGKGKKIAETTRMITYYKD